MTTVISWPAGLRAPAEFGIKQARYDLTELSDSTGHAAARVLGPPRWQVSMRSVDAFTLAEAGLYEAMLLQLRGATNYLALYDFVRSAPQGTLRGTLTLNAQAAAAATTCVLTGGTNGQTILPGDWFQIGTGVGTSQLVKAVASATVSGGLVTLTFEPPLRKTYNAATAVTWDKPLGYYKLTGPAGWSYRPGMRLRQGGFAIDLIEGWT